VNTVSEGWGSPAQLGGFARRFAQVTDPMFIYGLHSTMPLLYARLLLIICHDRVHGCSGTHTTASEVWGLGSLKKGGHWGFLPQVLLLAEGPSRGCKVWAPAAVVAAPTGYAQGVSAA
jgi:hypothetical protein